MKIIHVFSNLTIMVKKVTLCGKLMVVTNVALE